MNAMTIAHQHVCGGNRRAVFDDAVHLLTLCSELGRGHLGLLRDRVVWVVACFKDGHEKVKHIDFNQTRKRQKREKKRGKTSRSSPVPPCVSVSPCSPSSLSSPPALADSAGFGLATSAAS